MPRFLLGLALGRRLFLVHRVHLRGFLCVFKLCFMPRFLLGLLELLFCYVLRFCVLHLLQVGVFLLQDLCFLAGFFFFLFFFLSFFSFFCGGYRRSGFVALLGRVFGG